MKKLILASLLVGISSVAVAVPVCSGPTSDITSYTAGGGCTSGSLLFSNFVYTGSNGSGPTALTSIISGNGNILFNLQPNQGSSVSAQNSILAFHIMGLDLNALIIGTSSSNAGSIGSTIRQVVCSGSIDALGNCSGTLFQDVTNGAGSGTPTNSFAPQSSVNVWRKVFTPSSAAVTASTFDVQATPEPVAFALMGSGLIGLALFRKRRKN